MSHSSTRPLGKFNVPSCNGTGSEVAYIHIENDKDANYDQDSSLWATYGFVFDSDGVNATFTSPNATLYATAGDSQEFQSLFFRGSLKVTVSGVIDPWHSDILVSDGATPSWNSTVGYNASYYAYSGASGLKSPPALMIAFAAGLLSATLILV